MLEAVPKSLFAWSFDILDSGGASVGEVRLGSWRERGALTSILHLFYYRGLRVREY